MTVALPSTPANYFHLLRWQALSGRRKPLVVFTPKSMLRLKTAASPVADFTHGSFRPVIGDSSVSDSAAIRRVVLCSGKIYYDLAEKRAEAGLTDTAIVRVERLYPVPADELAAQLAQYPAATDTVWAQEEPANMGAWPTMALWVPSIAAPRPVRPISLPPSSAPAAGSAAKHSAEHRSVVETALAALT